MSMVEECDDRFAGPSGDERQQRLDLPLCVGLGKIASWNVVGSRMFIAVTAAFGCVACSVGGSTCGALGLWSAGVPNRTPDRTFLPLLARSAGSRSAGMVRL
jgi:hypothetical protein